MKKILRAFCSKIEAETFIAKQIKFDKISKQIKCYEMAEEIYTQGANGEAIKKTVYRVYAVVGE